MIGLLAGRQVVAIAEAMAKGGFLGARSSGAQAPG
jgi:hypothetical protein